MIERIYRCDGPDCDTHVRSITGRPVHGFITVTGSPPDVFSRHFCSWDCVLKYAATVEPMEVIE